MKKRLAKKVLCGSLSVALLCGQGNVYAAPVSADEGLPQLAGLDETAGGSIEVRFQIPEDIPVSQEFSIALNGEKKETYRVGSTEERKTWVTKYENLVPGTYTIRIEAEGYLPYEQTIEVDAFAYRLQVVPETGTDLSEDRMGTMLRGDVDGDGKLTQADASRLIDMLEKTEMDSVYDMNQDGMLDLVDLARISRRIGEENRPSEIEKYSLNPIVEGTLGENTVLADDQKVTDVLEGKPIQVGTSDGKSITESPVELSFDLTGVEDTLEGIALETPNDNAITEGSVLVTYEEDGEIKTLEIRLYASKEAAARAKGAVAYVNGDGTLTIDFGKKIAVKKVVLTITATTREDASLVEISKVEFLNYMEDYVPKPEISVPNLTLAEAGNHSIRVSWDEVRNVTGYEISIYHGGKTEYIKTTGTSYTITQFQKKELENKQAYTICVQAVNGSWSSGFSEEVTVIPKADTRPDAPDALVLKPEYKSITAYWKAPKDNAADSYTVYFKKKDDVVWQKVSDITGVRYTLEELDGEEEYQIYVTATNEYGEGPASLTASAKTTMIVEAQMNAYRLINRSNGEGNLSSHIVSASIGTGRMVDSPLDEEQAQNSALGLFDYNAASYWDGESWDTGGYNNNQSRAVSVTFDQEYTIGEIQFAEEKNITNYPYIRLYYQDASGKNQVMVCHWTSLTKTDENGRNYYRLKLNEPITVSSLSIGFGRYLASSPNVHLAEIRFYEYDSLSDEIQELYADDLHLTLKEAVTEDTFDALQKRLDTKVDGEYHPDREVLQKELDAARQLYLEDAELEDVLLISSEISERYNNGLKTSGLNAWQPLGVSAAAGETVVIYVGKDGQETGKETALQLVATQQHAESSSVGKVIMNLKTGRNEVTIPELISTDVEKGGALYIQYTGNNRQDAYAVRVNGGAKIPVLNLYQVEDATLRMEKIEQYIEELTAYEKAMRDTWTKETESIYNTTDLMLDTMMFSIPATQVLEGLGTKEPAQVLFDTAESMEKAMKLFYQNKGLTNDFADGTDASVIEKNHLPSGHLNIRYMKMFSGAFMYAAGNHIGIEWEQTAGLIQNGKTVINEKGQLTEGFLFGWGICHEIGHQINQKEYEIAEVTNNYFAQLAKSDGTNASARWKYEDVYQKVTSGTTGYPSDGAVQLAMYWQLHLAYDDAYAQKTYENYDEIFEHLFFARVDSYARKPELFEGEVALTLTGDKDQNLMRLATAAAGKDLSEFFRRWGYVPDEMTSAFMQQFEKETRAIYYGDDDAQSARIENQTVSLVGQEVLDAVQVTQKGADVLLKMLPKEELSDEILGYEIVRVTREKGQVKKEIVGFATGEEFTDQVNLGSRVVSYEVIPVDRNTGYAQAKSTEMVKVISDGSYDGAAFTVTTNLESALDKEEAADDRLPCEGVEISAVSMVLDGDKTAEYTGVAQTEPYLLIDCGRQIEMSALRYAAKSLPIGAYRIEVSNDGMNYKTVAEGEFALKEGEEVVYFTDGEHPWIATCEARYLKLTALEQEKTEISVAELTILGPSGDNVSFVMADNSPAIGYLEEDYIYQKAEDGLGEEKIPAGSLVFMGTYKGNPAYNLVALYDENGELVGGINEAGELVSNQIILAEVPEHAMLGEVSDGIWIYWIEKEELKNLPKQVRAELYRVDNAWTNEGERLVSDTLFTELGKELPYIRLGE